MEGMTVIRYQDGNIVAEDPGRMERILQHYNYIMILNYENERDTLCEIPPTAGTSENITLIEAKRAVAWMKGIERLQAKRYGRKRWCQQSGK